MDRHKGLGQLPRLSKAKLSALIVLAHDGVILRFDIPMRAGGGAAFKVRTIHGQEGPLKEVTFWSLMRDGLIFKSDLAISERPTVDTVYLITPAGRELFAKLQEAKKC